MNLKELKVLIIGVGNSGTKILGQLIHELLKKNGYPLYYYEPLYWKGTNGEANITLNQEGIDEHLKFPLLPDKSITDWPWMDRYLENLNGLAKFIRIGSRINCLLKHNVKIIWITRELYDFLGSMQKNFPRKTLTDGWHHRPGKYDDFKRIKAIYSDCDLRQDEEYRIEVEAAWWHLNNYAMSKVSTSEKIQHIRFEEFCIDPKKAMESVADFINIPLTTLEKIKDVHTIPKRSLKISQRNHYIVDKIAGELNSYLYSDYLSEKRLIE